MKITVDQLQVGDEIIVPSGGSKIKYVKVMRLPMVRKDRTNYKNGGPYYKSVKCSSKLEEVKYQITWGNNTYDRFEKIYEPTGEDHNTEKYYDLNNKELWLVKRI